MAHSVYLKQLFFFTAKNKARPVPHAVLGWQLSSLRAS